eukprot:8430936-Pyramimonas_sp.AAC.1
MGKDTITAFASTSSFGYTSPRIFFESAFISPAITNEGTEFETLSDQGDNDTSLDFSSAIAPSSIPPTPQSRSSWGRPRTACLPTSTIRLGSWNVEGLRGDSQVKFTELFGTMRKQNIDILCIQETHLHGTDYYKHEEGFLVCLSGELDANKRSDAGVGFIVAPWAEKSAVAFHASSPRLASLRIKIVGGMLTLITAYAPHSGHHEQVRRDFYSDLDAYIRPTTPHSTTMILGDFNARLLIQNKGEEHIISRRFAYPHQPVQK